MTVSAVLAALAVASQPAEAAPAPAPAPAPAVQDAPAAAAAEAPAEGAAGVLVFESAFFAEARPNTAADMVARIPGFAVSQDTSVRGFSGAVGNVLIDGARPASKHDALSDVLGRIPASQVLRIELIRGGAQGVDMQGFSQVINVVRRQGASRQHVLTGGFHLFERSNLIPIAGYELSGRDGDRIYELALRSTTSISNGVGVGANIRTDLNGGLLRDARVRGEAGGAGLSLRGRLQQPILGGTGEVSVSLSRSPFTYEETIVGGGFRQDFRDHFESTSGEFSARFQRPLSDRWSYELRGIQRLTETVGAQAVRVDTTDQRFDYDNLSGESILRGSVRFVQSPTLTWEGGVEGAYNFLDAQQALFLGGTRVPLPSDAVRVEELRAEGFVTAAWRVRENVTLDAAMRVEVSRISQSGGSDLEREFVYPKPRLLLTWSATPSDQIRLRVEREVSQLDFGDFAASASLQEGRVGAGNAELEPQKTWVLEAVYERRFWGDGVLTLSGQVGYLTDAIDLVPVVASDGSVFSAPGNIGDGEIRAFVAETTIPTDRLGIAGGRLRLRASWVNIDVTDPTTGVLRRSSGNAPFIGTVAWTHDIQSWRGSYGFEWQSASESVAYRIDELSRQYVENNFNVYAEWKPTPALTLRLQYYDIGTLNLTRESFTGLRNVGTLRYTDRRLIDPEARLQFRVRYQF